MINDFFTALLAAIYLILILALVWLAGRWVWRGITKDREPEPEPETHGDDGGRPTPMTHMEAGE